MNRRNARTRTTKRQISLTRLEKLFWVTGMLRAYGIRNSRARRLLDELSKA